MYEWKNRQLNIHPSIICLNKFSIYEVFVKTVHVFLFTEYLYKLNGIKYHT